MPFPSVVRTTGLAAALLIVAASAAADTLTADGATYENVYLNEGRSHVYVFMPDEGTVTSIPKDQVDSLELDPDRTRRAALRARWRVSRDRIAAEPSPVDTTQPRWLPTPSRPSWSPRRPAPEFRSRSVYPTMRSPFPSGPNALRRTATWSPTDTCPRSM
ncbi:MAG: hypothetical protein GY851_18235 [bacterium]|nr:hypothetical protein [bacterium]